VADAVALFVLTLAEGTELEAVLPAPVVSELDFLPPALEGAGPDVFPEAAGAACVVCALA
jgi:hypothetical protein